MFCRLYIIVALVALIDFSNGNQENVTRKKFRLSQSHHFEIIHRSLPLFVDKTLTICILERQPFVIYKRPETSIQTTDREAMADLNNYSGIAIEVLRRLISIFKFNIRIINPIDGQFGVEVAGKGWTGLLGSLVRNESDVGLTALSITVRRSQVVDFTRAYFVETGAILLPIPDEIQNYSALLDPFSTSVWIILLITIISLIVLITIMTKLEEDQRKQHKLANFLAKQAKGFSAREGSSRNHSMKVKLEPMIFDANQDENREIGSPWPERFYYAVTCVLNILLVRDIKHPPKQTPIRILVCVWWLSTIVIVNMYLGILFGQLVVPRSPKSIETLEELVSQRQVKWCVTRGSALDDLFRRSPAGTVYGQLGIRMHNVSTANEGVAKVLQSGWAFIRERSMLVFKAAEEHNRLRICRLQLAKTEFFSVGFGLALSKDSLYLKPFNSAITLMIENGFLSHWQSLYWPTRNRFTECKLQPLREGEPLSIKHFISIYLISSLAIGVSLTILIYQRTREHLFEVDVRKFLRYKKKS